MCLAVGKLERPGRLNAAASGMLAYLVDQRTSRHFLVDTGASYSLLPHRSTLLATGPRMANPLPVGATNRWSFCSPGALSTGGSFGPL